MAVKVKIQNIVCSVTYEDVVFPLEKLVRILENARYDPEVFPGIAYKSENPPASFLIFSSGKMNCVGARSLKDALLAVKKLTAKLQKAGIKIKKPPRVEVQNIVASLDFGRTFDLEYIAKTFENTEYEPEVFPGLVMRLEEPRAVVLLFVSGKGVCAGSKKFADIKKAAEIVDKLIPPIASAR